MKVETGSFTIASTGTQTLVLNDDTLVVKGIYLQISPTTTSSAEASTGFSDGTTNRAKSTLVTSTKRESYRSTTKCITHYKDVSGTSTQVVAASVTSLSTAGEVTFNFTAASASYPIDFMVFGE